MTDRAIGLKLLMVVGLLLIFMLTTVGCVGRLPTEAVVDVGMSQGEVRQLLGEPDLSQNFQMSEGFFGPQESLTGLVAAGTEVLEWQYLQDQQVHYVWFIRSGEGQSQWSVVATGSYPADAVY